MQRGLRYPHQDYVVVDINRSPFNPADIAVDAYTA